MNWSIKNQMKAPARKQKEGQAYRQPTRAICHLFSQSASQTAYVPEPVGVNCICHLALEEIARRVRKEIEDIIKIK